jgi:hypothetical protein
MPTDDPRFEDYLREFHPVAAPDFALDASPRPSRSSRVWWVSAGATAAILIAAFLFWHARISDRVPASTPAAQCCASPLTWGGANASLFGNASTSDALDRMVFPQRVKLPPGEQSALRVLGQEKAEL